MSGIWECKAPKGGCLDPLSRLIYPEEREDMIFDTKVDYIPSALQSKYFWASWKKDSAAIKLLLSCCTKAFSSHLKNDWFLIQV